MVQEAGDVEWISDAPPKRDVATAVRFGGDVPSNRLTPDSLEWALKHLDRDGDTDLFPRPFEIEALKAAQAIVLPEVAGIDITNHRWAGARKLLLPKDDFSFRSVTQLDPLDSLLFAAIIKEIGALIEARRSPLSEARVFSYRFNPTPGGQLYGDQSLWDDFWEASEDAARESRFVVSTDITDFYNHVNHHAVENQLHECGVAQSFTTALLNLLKELTQGVSRGLPVGPHPIHMLAESSLIPIDEFLTLKGYSFCRYVDDIHIFCGSAAAARIAIYDLADVLDKSQRLTLNRQKTTIHSSAQFIKRAQAMLKSDPINAEEKAILAIIKKRTTDPYKRIKISDLTNAELRKFSPERVEKILREYLAATSPDFIRIRWFLRRLSQVGSPGGIGFAVANIERLLPAAGDVATYLVSAERNFTGQWKDLGAQLLAAMKIPLVQRSEYLQVVLLGLFGRIAALNQVAELIQGYDRFSPSARRKVVLAATTAKASAWVRGLKEGASGFDPWLRRAVLYSGSSLPDDERKFWLGLVRKNANLLEKAIIQTVR